MYSNISEGEGVGLGRQNTLMFSDIMGSVGVTLVLEEYSATVGEVSLFSSAQRRLPFKRPGSKK